jgi:ion channel-forming bestrophin family protein
MVKYNPKDWFGLIFQFHKSDTFRQMFWVLLLFAGYTGVIVYLELHFLNKLEVKSTIQIHSLLGFVLALLLVFRTNSAYDRWWEGRKLWGALVNNSRNFSLKLNAILTSDTHKAYWSRMIINYAYAMKEHLRNGVKAEEIDVSDNPQLLKSNHVPNMIAADMYTELNALYMTKTISGHQLFLLDKELKEFTDIVGACERIKKTPIPYSYSLFLKKFIFMYTITLPFGLVFDYGYWTIPIVTLILYVLGSIELIGEEIEDPFGLEPNDLPTDELSATIKKNVQEIFAPKK